MAPCGRGRDHIDPARAGLNSGRCQVRSWRARPTAYFCFLGFFFSFWGLLSFATEILPYGLDYNGSEAGASEKLLAIGRKLRCARLVL